VESTLSDELMETTTDALTTPTSNNLTICVSIAAAQTVIIVFLVTGVVCCGVIFAKQGAFYYSSLYYQFTFTEFTETIIKYRRQSVKVSKPRLSPNIANST